MYVYQVFGLANMKALMQTAEIKFITVHGFLIIPQYSPSFPFPTTQLLGSELNFEIKLLVISLWLPLINTLSYLK